MLWRVIIYIMVKLGIKAKVKDTGEFVEHAIQVDDKIRDFSNDKLYDFIADFLEMTHSKSFKWFRFWTLP